MAKRDETPAGLTDFSAPELGSLVLFPLVAASMIALQAWTGGSPFLVEHGWAIAWFVVAGLGVTGSSGRCAVMAGSGVIGGACLAAWVSGATVEQAVRTAGLTLALLGLSHWASGGGFPGRALWWVLTIGVAGLAYLSNDFSTGQFAGPGAWERYAQVLSWLGFEMNIGLAIVLGATGCGLIAAGRWFLPDRESRG